MCECVCLGKRPAARRAITRTSGKQTNIRIAEYDDSVARENRRRQTYANRGLGEGIGAGDPCSATPFRRSVTRDLSVGGSDGRGGRETVGNLTHTVFGGRK